jgi:glycine/D-amino acid oxidase-like deaminating enzyme
MPRITRRELLKTSAAVGAALAVRPAAAAGPSVVVIGAGAFGGWTALHLLRKGASVTLVDAWGPGNSRSSSGGETRVIRATYGGSRLYTSMSVDSLRIWKENERRWERKLFYRTGAIWMSAQNDSYETAALPVLKELGVTFERLNAAEAGRRWPQVSFEGVSWVLHEPEAGYLTARRGCEAVFEAFVKEGGSYRLAQAAPGAILHGEMQGVRLNGTETLKAEQYVFACGPWLSKVFHFEKELIRPTRQEEFFFGAPPGDPRFTEEKMPVWIDNGAELYYGIPGNQWRGFKVATDSRGPVVDPTSQERRVTDAGLAAARALLSRRFPLLKDAPLVESRVCQYENSPDENFILDRHPDAGNAWIVGGGSGHGYKHGPKIGDMVSDALLGKGKLPAEFSLARLSSAFLR